MRIAVIPEDKSVVVDGETRSPLEFDMDTEIHAVQWYDTWGEVEYKLSMVNNMMIKPPNQIIHNMDLLQSALDSWNNWQPEPTPPPPPPPVPKITVTARQARLQLHSQGLLGQVESVVTQMGGSVQIEWEYATVIERDSPLISQIADQLSLTSEQIDQMFAQARLL